MKISLLIKSAYHWQRMAVIATFITICLSSCATYRVETFNQPGTEYQKCKVNSFFWGLLQSPKQVTTPVCDSLNTGLSEVLLRRNFGAYVASFITLGTWSPATLEWKCSKPCQKSGSL
jgi:hypothetical protein